jgi:hypothetical protein
MKLREYKVFCGLLCGLTLKAVKQKEITEGKVQAEAVSYS